MSFSRHDGLKTHSKTHEASGRKKFSCSQCKAELYSKSSLNDHLLIHTGERKFECTECKDKAFKTRTDLKSHMRVHSGLKRWAYTCQQCEKRFTTKNSLNIHCLQHTGEKPHLCNLCNKRFTQIGHMKDHTFRVHGLS